MKKIIISRTLNEMEITPEEGMQVYLPFSGHTIWGIGKLKKLERGEGEFEVRFANGTILMRDMGNSYVGYNIRNVRTLLAVDELGSVPFHPVNWRMALEYGLIDSGKEVECEIRRKVTNTNALLGEKTDIVQWSDSYASLLPQSFKQQTYSQEELDNKILDFAQWYSGMERAKVKDALNRYRREIATDK